MNKMNRVTSYAFICVLAVINKCASFFQILALARTCSQLVVVFLRPTAITGISTNGYAKHALPSVRSKCQNNMPVMIVINLKNRGRSLL